MVSGFLSELIVQQASEPNRLESHIYKQLFEKNEDPIGGLIQMNNINFKVIGVFQNEDLDMGPNSDVHIPFTTFFQRTDNKLMEYTHTKRKIQ